MSFGLSGAAIAGIAVGGATLASGYMSSKAAGRAADSQAAAAQAGVDEQSRQFDAIQKLLLPFVQAGAGVAADPGGKFDAEAYLRENPDVAASSFASDPLAHYNLYGKKEGRNFPLTAATQAKPGALQYQQDLLGLNGAAAQQAQIDQIKNSPMFTSMLQQGENSILQNASATGGLRGGNTQAALAQFSPALLAQTIQQRFDNLGGLTQLGQSSAAGVANAGLTTSGNIANLLQRQGSAQAGGALGQAAGYQTALSGITSGLGAYQALGGKF